MSNKKDREKVQKSIKRFIKKEGRVGFELRELNELFRMGHQISNFYNILGKQHSLQSAFKTLLLMHRLIIERSQPQQFIIDILSRLTYTPCGDFQQLLSQKLMQPYRLYLQRRTLLWTWQLQLSSKAERQARMYQLLNLINLGTSFVDIIYTFGRYYMNNFACAIDFNIILGADLQGLYENMVENVSRPAKVEILAEIETVHQKMYVVFYNCYFHRYLKNYVPKWVITDISHKSNNRRSVTPQKETNKSLYSTNGTSKYRSSSSAKTKATSTLKSSIEGNLADSCLMLNEKVQEQVSSFQQDLQQSSVFEMVENEKGKEKVGKIIGQQKYQEGELNQRLKLLLSMERVLGEIKYF